MTFPNSWAAISDDVVADIKKQKLTTKFDLIACSGLSGVMVAVPVAKALKKDLIIVRKGDNFDAYKDAIEGDGVWKYVTAAKKHPRVLFIDDWIAGGRTRLRVGKAMHNLGAKVTCQYLHSGNGNRVNTSSKGFCELPEAITKSFGPVKKFADVGYY